MERGSAKHGARLDDEMSHEVEDMTRSGRPTRAEEGRDPEPPADDDPRAAWEARPEQSDTGAANEPRSGLTEPGDEEEEPT